MRLLADGRVRRSASEWRGVLAKFEASGLSALAFCQQERVSPSAFTRWRQELRSAPAADGAFLEVSPCAPVGVRPLAPGEFELALAGSVVLRWRP